MTFLVEVFLGTAVRSEEAGRQAGRLAGVFPNRPKLPPDKLQFVTEERKN